MKKNLIKTVEEMKNDIVSIYGLEHPNTVYFFEKTEQTCGFITDNLIKIYYHEILTTAPIFNGCEIAHINIELEFEEITKLTTIELINPNYKDYIDLCIDIEQAIIDIYGYDAYKDCFVNIVNVITN